MDGSASKVRKLMYEQRFGVLCAAQALGRAHSVSLFDPTNDFEFLPNIHELISRHTRPKHLRLSRLALDRMPSSCLPLSADKILRAVEERECLVGTCLGNG